MLAHVGKWQPGSRKTAIDAAAQVATMDAMRALLVGALLVACDPYPNDATTAAAPPIHDTGRDASGGASGSAGSAGSSGASGAAGEAGQATAAPDAGNPDPGTNDAGSDAADDSGADAAPPDAGAGHGLGSSCVTPGSLPAPGDCVGYATPVDGKGLHYGPACAGLVGSGAQRCTFFCDTPDGFGIAIYGETQCVAMGGSCAVAPNTGQLRVCGW